MLDRIVFALTLLSALGCGIVGGVFFGFSTFVMGALGRIPPAQGIAAMQAINVAVINPLFMTAFMGTGVGCLALAVHAVLTWGRPGAGWMLGGALLYLVGTLVLTIVFHVPRNDALAAVDPASDVGAKLWADYLTTWTAGNHVRAAAAIVAAGLLILALYVRRAL